MEKRFGRGKQSYLGDLLTMVINHFLNGMIRTPWFKSPLSGSGGGTPSKWPFMAEINGGEPLKQVLGWSSKCIPKKFHIGPWKVTAAQERIVFYPCIQIQRLCLHFLGCNGKMVRIGVGFFESLDFSWVVCKHGPWYEFEIRVLKTMSLNVKDDWNNRPQLWMIQISYFIKK